MENYSFNQCLNEATHTKAHILDVISIRGVSKLMTNKPIAFLFFYLFQCLLILISVTLTTLVKQSLLECIIVANFRQVVQNNKTKIVASLCMNL